MCEKNLSQFFKFEKSLRTPAKRVSLKMVQKCQSSDDSIKLLTIYFMNKIILHDIDLSRSATSRYYDHSRYLTKNLT